MLVVTAANVASATIWMLIWLRFAFSIAFVFLLIVFQFRVFEFLGNGWIFLCEKQKPADLEGTCPFNIVKELCPYGLTCRFASTHSEGVSLEDENTPKKNFEINGLNKDLQRLLWKNKVSFPKSSAQLKLLGLSVSKSLFKKTFFFSIVHLFLFPLCILSPIYELFHLEHENQRYMFYGAVNMYFIFFYWNILYAILCLFLWKSRSNSLFDQWNWLCSMAPKSL